MQLIIEALETRGQHPILVDLLSTDWESLCYLCKRLSISLACQSPEDRVSQSLPLSQYIVVLIHPQKCKLSTH